MVRNTRNFFNSKKKQGRSGEQSLNKAVRNQEFSRIMADNEAMLKRLQARQSNYNVTGWDKDRRSQIRLIKQICHFKPTLIKRKKLKRRQGANEDKLDMQTRYASAGHNRHMFEMYNLNQGSSLHQLAQFESVGNNLDNRFI